MAFNGVTFTFNIGCPVPTTSTTTTTTTFPPQTNYTARRFSCSGLNCGTDQGVSDSISISNSMTGSITLGTTYAFASDYTSSPYVYRIDSIGGSAGLLCSIASSCGAACTALGGA